MKINFSKYHGTGNDFILVDDRQDRIRMTVSQIEQLCDRRFGIGADGLILLKNKPAFDFELVYYNADGNQSSMCGNGGRCIVAFAHSLGVIGDQTLFSAVDGSHEAIIQNSSPLIVKLKMNDVSKLEEYPDFTLLDTGSPHYVKFIESVAQMDVVEEGKKTRYSERFKKSGVNVNFVQATPAEIIVRTYERGVEDETLSCGTGVTAAALAAVSKNKADASKGYVDILTPGGRLKVWLEKNGTGYKNIWLEGEATFVYRGEIEV